jgi:hypothetical protein
MLPITLVLAYRNATHHRFDSKGKIFNVRVLAPAQMTNGKVFRDEPLFFMGKLLIHRPYQQIPT